MKRVLAVFVMLSVMLTVAAVSVSAFTMAEQVVVASQIVLVARVPAGGYTPEERISAMNDRLAPILGYEVLTPNNIRLQRVRGETGIFVGDRLLTTVTAADARANGTTVNGLARVWLRQARQAIPQARPYANVYTAQ